jgi:hypothetical protein
MRLHLKYGCAAALAVAMVTQAALATATLTRDDRELVIEATASENGAGLTTGEVVQTPSFGDAFGLALGSGLIESQPAGDAQAQATAQQISSFDASPDFMSVHAEGVAEARGQIDAFALIASNDANAESNFVIEFNITVPMTWTLDASILDEGSGSTGYVRLRPVGGSNIFNLDQNSGVSVLSDTGTLQPGDYELLAKASGTAFGSQDFNTFFDRDAEFALDFSIVPEPASGLLLLLGGVAALRRRWTR